LAPSDIACRVEKLHAPPPVLTACKGAHNLCLAMPPALGGRSAGLTALELISRCTKPEPNAELAIRSLSPLLRRHRCEAHTACGTLRGELETWHEGEASRGCPTVRRLKFRVQRGNAARGAHPTPRARSPRRHPAQKALQGQHRHIAHVRQRTCVRSRSSKSALSAQSFVHATPS